MKKKQVFPPPVQGTLIQPTWNDGAWVVHQENVAIWALACFKII